jgi:hypothetical protein
MIPSRCSPYREQQGRHRLVVLIVSWTIVVTNQYHMQQIYALENKISPARLPFLLPNLRHEGLDNSPLMLPSPLLLENTNTPQIPSTGSCRSAPSRPHPTSKRTLLRPKSTKSHTIPVATQIADTRVASMPGGRLSRTSGAST